MLIAGDGLLHKCTCDVSKLIEVEDNNLYRHLVGRIFTCKDTRTISFNDSVPTADGFRTACRP